VEKRSRGPPKDRGEGGREREGDPPEPNRFSIPNPDTEEKGFKETIPPLRMFRTGGEKERGVCWSSEGIGVTTRRNGKGNNPFLSGGMRGGREEKGLRRKPPKSSLSRTRNQRGRRGTSTTGGKKRKEVHSTEPRLLTLVRGKKAYLFFTFSFYTIAGEREEEKSIDHVSRESDRERGRGNP